MDLDTGLGGGSATGGAVAEARLAARRNAAALAARRMAEVEALVEARLALLATLRKVHAADGEGRAHWVDCVRLTQRQLREYYGSPGSTTRCAVQADASRAPRRHVARCLGAGAVRVRVSAWPAV